MLIVALACADLLATVSIVIHIFLEFTDPMFEWPKYSKLCVSEFWVELVAQHENLYAFLLMAIDR